MNAQEVLRLIADQIDAGQNPCDLWEVPMPPATLPTSEFTAPRDCSEIVFYAHTARLKPKTHIVHGVECPAPMSEEPERGTRYYSVNLGKTAIPYYLTWINDPTDVNLFRRGGAFHTADDALANAKARYPELFE